jgi:hypothetical protein
LGGCGAGSARHIFSPLRSYKQDEYGRAEIQKNPKISKKKQECMTVVQRRCRSTIRMGWEQIVDLAAFVNQNLR